MTCSLTNCEKPIYAKGYCNLHYRRLNKHGDPNYVNRVWDENRIETELLQVMKALCIDRMPTSDELRKLGRNDLHLKISRTKKYSGWAEYLGLGRKSSETLIGQKYESVVSELLHGKGHSVEKMSTKYPYDLLVNGSVKVDVKVGSAYLMRGSRVHSFGINKKIPTCDLYIILALDEDKQIERTFIIPSHQLKVVSLCIGNDSKYNKFVNRWDFIDSYTNFFKQIG